MWISDRAISKPVVTTVLMLALVIFGVGALAALDTDEFPAVQPPVVSVAIPYPGASPEVVEREVVEPLEEAFQSMSGLDELRSTSLDGYAILIVTFDFKKNLQAATQDIRDKISEIRADLPPEMEEPVLTRFDPADLPIVSATLVSEKTEPVDLTQLADPGVTSKLRSIAGVADVTVVGGVERELTVELRPTALQAAGVDVATVVRALESQNLAAPVGRLTGKLDERTIRLKGRLAAPADFAQLPIAGAGDKLVRLGDVADVRDGAEEPRSLAFFDGKRAVGIDIKKALGYSTTDVSDRVRARLAEVQKTLPEGITLNVVRDSGVRVARSVKDVETSLLEGALLTILVIFLFLKSWRSTIITGLALPVSVLASFIAVWAFGFTLNTMSLLGLSLSIGILIDDAIVVRENIVRHMEKGADHVTAAREGTSEIGLAVAATTFSIVVVFVPIAFMGGIAQQWFAPFALTIACSVLVSLFVSFSLDPMLSAIWPDPEVEGHRRTWLSRKLDFFERGLDRLTRRYQKTISWALRHRWATVGIALVSFVAALAIPATGLVGSAFFPIQDRSEFNMHLDMPPGSNVEYTREKVLAATAAARQHREVAYTYATVGGQGGTVDEATMYVRLVPRKDRERHQDLVAEDLRGEIRALGGATAYTTTGFGNEKQIQLRLEGPDLPVLTRIASEVAARVRTVAGAVDVGLSSKGQRPELAVSLDRPLAGSLGVSVAQIAQALRPAFAGLDAGDWVDPRGKTRDVMVRLAPEARTRPEDLEALPLVLATAPGAAAGAPAAPGAPGGAPSGAPATAIIPLGQVAHLERALGPAQIEHLDGQRVIVVGANTEGRPLSAVIGDLEKKLGDVAFPPGYARSQGGETKSQREVFGRIFAALGIAVLLMYLVLVVQFGSFVDPLPIMASLPLSLIGVMLAMWITGSTLNLMSLIGVILLMGLVAKNAILLIDFAKMAEKQGKTREEALVEAGGVRLRPILMTSVAIVAGMLPVAIGGGEGGDFRAPLGRAVIGGVITSTLLTLLVIPTFYDIVANARDRLVARMKRGLHHGRPGPHGAPSPAAPPAPAAPVTARDAHPELSSRA